jgi:LysR family nitrogen assimilation transcriptional regulator
MSNNVVKLGVAPNAVADDRRESDRRAVHSRRIPMDMRQLRYFIAVVDAGSFSRAAELVHIAQPALSQHVLSMESMLGVALLQRNARGVVPTEAGLRLLDRARNIEAQFVELSEHVRGAKAPSGQVRLGMSPAMNELLGLPLIEACREKYPGVRIRISEAMSGFVAGWIMDGTVDLALIHHMVDEKRVKLHHALTEEILLFGPPSAGSVPVSKTVTLGAALELPLILPGSMHGLRDLIEVAAKSVNRRVDPAIEIDSYRQIKRLVASGLGYGLLPASALKQEIDDGTFQSWRISQPTTVRRVCLGYRADLPLSAASRAIANLVWQTMDELVRAESWTAKWDGEAELDL